MINGFRVFKAFVIFKLSVFKDQTVNKRMTQAATVQRGEKSQMSMIEVDEKVKAESRELEEVSANFYLMGFDKLFCLASERYDSIQRPMGCLIDA